jgi:hypothetical protein
MGTDIEIIIDRLDAIKEELDYIKENMVEKDEILSSCEFEAYQRSFDSENLVSLEDVKKELGL